MSYITVGRESIEDLTELLELWENIGERGLRVDSQEVWGYLIRSQSQGTTHRPKDHGQADRGY
jgi:hypothetical protein